MGSTIGLGVGREDMKLGGWRREYGSGRRGGEVNVVKTHCTKLSKKKLVKEEKWYGARKEIMV